MQYVFKIYVWILQAELLDLNTVTYAQIAEMFSNGTGTLFVFHLKLKVENICPRMYYSGSKFEVNMVNILCYF